MTDVTKFIDKETGEIHIGEAVIGPNLNWDNIEELASYGTYGFDEEVRDIHFSTEMIAAGISVKVYAAVFSFDETPTIRLDCNPPEEFDIPGKEWNYIWLEAGKVWLKAVLGEPDGETEQSISYEYDWGAVSIFVSRDIHSDLRGGEIMVDYKRK